MPPDAQRFAQPHPGHRDWYAYEALRMLPRILLMIDKNPYSKTYGCFDREYWHYRTTDFPCAMNQEFCLTLALAYALPMPNNPFYQQSRLRELAQAAINFAEKSPHPDGSCDDYFPFERALGAQVFSTYAMTESYQVLGLQNPQSLNFFRTRGNWLLANNESGQLSNHQALAALALFNIYLLTGEEKYRVGSDRFRDHALSWQHEEGWFQEYEGADPGYHSCSIDFLSKLYQKSKNPLLLAPLEKAVRFATWFLHPDGSYGGEYGSRNTYHFYPHGFELLAPHIPQAGNIAETYLHQSLPRRTRYFNDDNRMCAHYVYNWMQAWKDYASQRQPQLEATRAPFEQYFPACGLFIKKTATYYAVAALNKGGVIKIFNASGALASDTGLVALSKNGSMLVAHRVDRYVIERHANSFTISGHMHVYRQKLSSPVKQIIFRMINLTMGRFAPDLMRRVLQKILITGKSRSEVKFTRVLTFDETDVTIQDSLDATASRENFIRLSRSSDATSIYVANSNTFQESILLSWTDLSQDAPALNASRVMHWPVHSCLASNARKHTAE